MGRDVLSEIRDGDLIAFRGHWPHSRVIEGWTRSAYSHVATAWWMPTPDGDSRLVVIEALESLTGGRVQIQPLDHYLEYCADAGCGVDWYRLCASEAQRVGVVAFQLRHLGQRYASLLQMVWSFCRLNKWVRRVFGVPVNLDPSRWFCSELAADSYEENELLPRDYTDPAMTDPGQCTGLPCVRYGGTLV